MSEQVLVPLKSPTTAGLAEGGTALGIIAAVIGIVNSLHPGTISPDATTQIVTILPIVVGVFKWFRKFIENRQLSTVPTVGTAPVDVNKALAAKKDM